jgi:hypothetical protein
MPSVIHSNRQESTITMPAFPDQPPSDLTHPDHHTKPLPNVVCRAMVRNLSRGLPDPETNTPEAHTDRDHAAIAELALLSPADAGEMRIALRCVMAEAWAAEFLRLMSIHAEDIHTLLRLTPQAAAMTRAANAGRTLLLRLQAPRRRRITEAEAAIADEQAMERTQDGLMQAWEELAEELAIPLPKAPALLSPARAGSQRATRNEKWQQIVAQRRAQYEAAMAAGEPEPDWMTAAWRMTLGLPEPPPPTPEEKQRLHWLDQADRYAIIYPLRSRLIRRLGNLPPNCGIEPPEPELLHAIRTGKECNQEWADNLTLHQAKLNAGRDRDLLWKYEEELAQAAGQG